MGGLLGLINAHFFKEDPAFLSRVAIGIDCTVTAVNPRRSRKLHTQNIYFQLSVSSREQRVFSPLTVSEPPPRGSVLPNPAGLFSAYMVDRMSEMYWILIPCSSLCVRSGLGRGVKHIPEGIEGFCRKLMRNQPAHTVPVKMAVSFSCPHRNALGQGCALPWWSFTRKHWKRRVPTM